jgi:hypothetical protein
MQGWRWAKVAQHSYDPTGTGRRPFGWADRTCALTRLAIVAMNGRTPLRGTILCGGKVNWKKNHEKFFSYLENPENVTGYLGEPNNWNGTEHCTALSLGSHAPARMIDSNCSHFLGVQNSFFLRQQNE